MPGSRVRENKAVKKTEKGMIQNKKEWQAR
jgi:hypothetical protein